jgi:hypothetical protein
MVVHGYFRQKMGIVQSLIIDQMLVHLTPHMFPCHKSHSWISGGDHFFDIIQNGRSWLILTLFKMVVRGYF